MTEVRIRQQLVGRKSKSVIIDVSVDGIVHAGAWLSIHNGSGLIFVDDVAVGLDESTMAFQRWYAVSERRWRQSIDSPWQSYAVVAGAGRRNRTTVERRTALNRG